MEPAAALLTATPSTGRLECNWSAMRWSASPLQETDQLVHGWAAWCRGCTFFIVIEPILYVYSMCIYIYISVQ